MSTPTATPAKDQHATIGSVKSCIDQTGSLDVHLYKPGNRETYYLIKSNSGSLCLQFHMHHEQVHQLITLLTSALARAERMESGEVSE